VVALGAALAALSAAPPALAHATLEQTTPGNDTVVQRTPPEVTLRFSEPIETSADAVRVFDANGKRVDDGSISRPSGDAVAVGIDGTLPDGTYTVAWRAVSADTHPVFGAFVFHVGEPGANPNGIGRQVLEEGATPKSVSVTFTALRFFSYALLFGCVGGTALLALALGAAAPDLRGRLLGALAVVAGGLAIVSLFGLVLQGASAEGLGLANAFRWQVTSPVLDTRFGQVWLARAGLAAALAAIALLLRRGRWPDVLLDVALVLCVGLVITPAAAGHSNSSGALSFVADVVHVQAGAIWAGGLAFLVLALLLARERRWELASTAVPRFSTMAVFSVAALLIAGVINGYLQVRTWSGLWETTYGILLLVKVALVLPVLGLGLYNNRRSVPRLRAGAASALERRRFLRTAGAELAVIVAILAVTAVLVAEPPAKAIASPSGPYATTTELGNLELNLVVDPAVAGRNAIHLYLLKPNGQPADVAEVKIAASLASGGIGPLRFTAKRLAPGHYTVASANLTIPGDWELQVDARRGEFESLTAALSVPVRSAS
jgi:copper transport protein